MMVGSARRMLPMIRFGFFGFALCCVGLNPSVASAKRSPMTLDDIARLKNVSAPSVSPDGGSIAFLQINPRNPFKGKDGPVRSFLMIKRGNAEPRLYVGGDMSVKSYRWAPDANAIYFVGEKTGDTQNALYVVPLDGGTHTKVCALDQKRNIDAFDVHPDGKRLVVVSAPAKNAAVIKAQKRGFDAVVYEESKRASQMAIVRPQPGRSCKMRPIRRRDHVRDALISPRGDRVLVKVSPTPHVDDGYMQTRMRILSLAGAERTRIENLGKLGTARWSPDGRLVAYIGVDDYNDPSAGRLKIADARSGEIRDLLPNLLGQVEDFVWMDDQHIGAVIHFGVESEVWSVDAKSGEHTTLVPQGGQVVRALAAAKGRIALTADAPRHPTELFQLTDGKVERLTVSNPWLADRILSRQEAIEFEARDGLKIQGVLIYPTRYRKGRRYPLLIFVHGGPEAHRSNGWLTRYSAPIQVAANRGYVSFVPNYRGSTGRGVEFSKLGQHAYTSPEFDDIVDGKNHLVKTGLVNRRKVGITGGSYGGYATAWSATALTEHYAAGVMFVGISNQISKFGTTDIPQEMYAVHARAWPWDDWQWMLERSPIYHAPKSKTPLLIMHGDSDPRVHPSQSLEMYRFLKVAGKAPVRLVWYPGEGHGNRRAAARYDYSVRFMRWMDHYLKGKGGPPPPYQIDYRARLKDD